MQPKKSMTEIVASSLAQHEAEAQRLATQFFRQRPDASGCRTQAGGIWFSFRVDASDTGERIAVRRPMFDR
jgi:hypothetical protein